MTHIEKNFLQIEAHLDQIPMRIQTHHREDNHDTQLDLSVQWGDKNFRTQQIAVHEDRKKVQRVNQYVAVLNCPQFDQPLHDLAVLDILVLHIDFNDLEPKDLMKEAEKVDIAQHLDKNFKLVREADLQFAKYRKHNRKHGFESPGYHQVFIRADDLVAVPTQRVSEQYQVDAGLYTPTNEIISSRE